MSCISQVNFLDMQACRSVPQSETAGHACDGYPRRPRPARRQAAAYHRLTHWQSQGRGRRPGHGLRRRPRPPGPPARDHESLSESETAAEAQAGTASDSESQAGLAAAAPPAAWQKQA